MTRHSVVLARLASWYRACEVWDFNIDPSLTSSVLDELDEGVVQFCAARTARRRGEQVRVTLTVAERWAAGADPHGDRRLEAEGCFVEALAWHLQVGATSGDAGAERLDVTPEPDPVHPRVHRHPYGSENTVREPAELPPPQQWLHQLNQTLGGLLDDEDFVLAD